MKATRRHELKENDLAHAIEVARGYLSEHGTRVGVLVLCAIAAITVVSITVRTRAGNAERVWAEKGRLLFDDPDGGKESIDKLRVLTTEATDDSFVLTSLIEQGRHALRLAQQVEVPPDPDLNDRARDAFNTLLERFPDNPLALGVAHSGLATIAENDFAVDSDRTHQDQARRHLQAIIDDPALNTLPFHRLASDRLAKLDGIFTIVRFAPPAEPEETEAAAAAPITITPTPIDVTATPISIDELPASLRRIAGPPGGVVPGQADDGGVDEAVEEGGDEQSSDQSGGDASVDVDDESADTP